MNRTKIDLKTKRSNNRCRGVVAYNNQGDDSEVCVIIIPKRPMKRCTTVKLQLDRNKCACRITDPRVREKSFFLYFLTISHLFLLKEHKNKLITRKQDHDTTRRIENSKIGESLIIYRRDQTLSHG